MGRLEVPARLAWFADLGKVLRHVRLEGLFQGSRYIAWEQLLSLESVC